jgi:type 1 fimbriae regulatory protein FimB/type 1 fimbriae regulatory protein FimE
MHVRNNAISSPSVLPANIQYLSDGAQRNLPQRLKNRDYRSREYLTEHEVDQLIAAAGKIGRHSHRDATLSNPLVFICLFNVQKRTLLQSTIF